MQTSSYTLPATKITQAFERAKNELRGALIPYFMCGYPSAERSVELALAAAGAGADIIELGIPFSDPLADGATIQRAGQVALESGMTLKGCLDIAQRVSTQTDVPLILMGHYNPVHSYGLEHFCADAAASGASGLIIPDLPPEEATPLQQRAAQHGLALIFLVPPTAPDERIAAIVQAAMQGIPGFLYCVALNGVTGSRTSLPPHLREFVARVHSYTKSCNLPLAVGFGLSTREHIAAVTSYADGAVVGSAIVNVIDRSAENKQVEAVTTYIRDLKNQ